MGVTVLGVRHHGPGSARAVRAELERLRPGVVLIEGPPEADGLVGLAPELEPPVALLAHVPGRPDAAAFWPFASFSPEWQAMLYAAEAGVPVRFCDLPAACSLAADEDERPRETDPIGALAEAAGYDDPERWWEDVVEHRGDTPFEVIAEAMAAVREGYVPAGREARREAYMRRTLRAAVKEGHERIAVVCGAWHVPALTGPLPPVKDDDAVLRGMPRVKAALTWVPWTYGRLAWWSGYGAGISSPGWYDHLFTVPDRPVERWLAGAAAVLREEGLAVSPAHVIEAVRLAEGLAALRGRPLAGLGEVTEAVRAVLCEGDELAVELVQRRMVVGDRLGRVTDGTPMVPLQRDLRDQQRVTRLRPEAADRRLDLDLRKALDLARSRLLHRLRLLGVGWGEPVEARGKGTFRESWALRWRPEFDLALIERAALGTTVAAAASRHARDQATTPVPAPAPGRGRTRPAPAPGAFPAPAPGLGGRGGPAPGPGGSGGGTAPGPGGRGGGPAPAPGSAARGRAGGVGGGLSLAGLTGLVEQCLLADLPEALPEVLGALSARAAVDTDVTHLMAALPAMARAHRYGDVRGTPAEGLAVIVRSMLDRICVGLPVSVAALDDGAAAALLEHVDAVHAAVALLEEDGDGQGEGPRGRWLATLRGICDRPELHGLVEGRLTRILLDAGELGDAGDRMSRAMSRGGPPARAAAWVEGFLAGGGLLLVHDPRLLGLVDAWLSGLGDQQFVEVLPLLRRTFAGFAVPERRAIGERVRSAGAPGGPEGERELDAERAAAAATTVLAILGRRHG